MTEENEIGKSTDTSDVLYQTALKHLSNPELLNFFRTKNSDEISIRFLAQGEYNINYELSRGVQKAVLRLNTGSQMHLENQIRYEYETLKILEPIGVTPKPLLVDDSYSVSPYGMLLMEYIPGRWLDYPEEFRLAAKLFAKIHEIKYDKSFPLIATPRPATAVLAECFEMSNVYLESDLGKDRIKSLISKIRDKIRILVEQFAQEFDLDTLVLNNTEVNSSNFLVDEDEHRLKLVDWEKAVFSVPTQDLSHFVVPTTTLWKSDYMFSEEEVEQFIQAYCEDSPISCSTIKEQMRVFWPLTCLRGVTWCAMAYTEYLSPGRLLMNDFTFNKIKMYIEASFIEKIFKTILIE